jgi:hypothetical protein
MPRTNEKPSNLIKSPPLELEQSDLAEKFQDAIQECVLLQVLEGISMLADIGEPVGSFLLPGTAESQRVIHVLQAHDPYSYRLGGGGQEWVGGRTPRPADFCCCCSC